MKNRYGHGFYANRHRRTLYAASRILSIVLAALPPVRSALDLGCGVGTWLSALSTMGIDDLLGMDGDWVDRRLLRIPQERFRAVDLEATMAMDRRWDLAISLEVAEHLAPARAGHFIDTLTAASDFVVFSAAIPAQGGVGHVNEQWPDYWAAQFTRNGYGVLDIVRPRIWNDARIPFWYRQNTLLFVKRDRLPELSLDAASTCAWSLPLSLVHPELYLARQRRP